MTTAASRRLHIEHVLVEVTSLLVERARAQLERESTTDESAANQLRRLNGLEQELQAIRHEIGLIAAASNVPTSAEGRQVSRFYDVPGQEDA